MLTAARTRFFSYNIRPGVEVEKVQRAANRAINVNRSHLIGRVLGHFVDRSLDHKIIVVPSDEALYGDYPFEGIDCDTFNPSPLKGSDLATFLIEECRTANDAQELA